MANATSGKLAWVGAMAAIAALALRFAPVSDPPAPQDTTPRARALPASSVAAAIGQDATEGAAPVGHRTRAPDPIDTAAKPDAAWLLLPRTKRDVTAELVVQPQSAASARLLRSATFNPRDVWLSVAFRLEVADSVTAANPDLQLASMAHDAASAREFANAQAGGLATAIDFSKPGGALLLAALGPSPVCRFVDGVNYAVRRTDMPDTCRAQQQLRQLGLGLVQRLAAAFARAGTLDDDEVTALLELARLVADD